MRFVSLDRIYRINRIKKPVIELFPILKILLILSEKDTPRNS